MMLFKLKLQISLLIRTIIRCYMYFDTGFNFGFILLENTCRNLHIYIFVRTPGALSVQN